MGVAAGLGGVITAVILAFDAGWLGVLLALPVAVAAGGLGYAGFFPAFAVGWALYHVSVVASDGGYHPSDVADISTVALIGAGVAYVREAHRRARAQVAESRPREARLLAANRRLTVLNDTAAAICSSICLEEILKGALERTLDALELESGAVYLLERQTGDLVLAAHQGLTPEFLTSVAELRTGEGLSGRVVLTGAPVLIKDAATDARLAHMVASTGHPRSFASVPITSGEAIVGAFSVASRGARVLSEEDVELMVAIANQLGVAARNARLYEEVRRLAGELQEALAREKALQAQRLRTAQLEGVLHAMRAVQDRVNNPLMVIVATAELLELKAASLSPDVRRALERIVEAAHEIAAVNQRIGRITVPVVVSTPVGEMIDVEMSEHASRGEDLTYEG